MSKRIGFQSHAVASSERYQLWGKKSPKQPLLLLIYTGRTSIKSTNEIAVNGGEHRGANRAGVSKCYRFHGNGDRDAEPAVCFATA